MRDKRQYFSVNWIDGMKINKNHFIDQDNSFIDALQDAMALNVTPLRYGVLPSSAKGENTFDVKLSLDNQDSLRVSVISCEAVTTGGVRISLPTMAQVDTGNALTATFPFSSEDSNWWVFLMVNPYEKQAVGKLDHEEDPPRYANVLPTYSMQLISETNFKQFANHPYAMPIGKVVANGNDIRVDEHYIPPCYCIAAHNDLISLHGELDSYLSSIELFCSQIVQKIYRKDQKNEISELVNFLCDRVVQNLGQSITSMRMIMPYEPPVVMFSTISSLARVMKNAIDLRTGSGKDELMNYLSEWCELKQGELESMLAKLANTTFQHNDINKNIQQVVVFVKITMRLFDTLSKLEFIGKKKDTSIFLKEEATEVKSETQEKAKRRFFG